ncbi:M24 family metallopeptidase [Halopelagius longus]|uniref:Aminopeptidase P family protein n=1 Tax=Halopelagius longus TaxID=1236180 RepID=A0A1H1B7K3_9EURY|nr:Xaa-Pro peptidase family protein [Halopelagius longus]RDI70660.1 aminopeptidase P family protein [Halopelagius longus]SDQ47386.1 Xaa-Pro aminopeptidase [Halopelagius longus]
MEPDLSLLDEYLADRGLDGYLVNAASTDSTQRYVSGFDAPDPFVTLYTPERTSLLVSSLEYGRAKKESRADRVARLVEYDYRELAAEHGSAEATARAVAAFLDDEGVESVATPDRFPLGPADTLRERGVTVEPETEDVVTEIRATKTDEEVEHVRNAQDANEAAMRAAETLLADADVRDGTLVYEGDSLTAERVKEEIELTLLRHGCALDETIVACGADAADPHNRGSGPLRADEPVIVDIFPRSKETKYHADMTRTFLKGDASETVREWFELTDEARTAALDAVEPGATGADVHGAVCDVYEEAGHPTLRSDPTTETGFIHSTGHGVGLDVHERPRVSLDGGELKPGHVITIEPGLYDPEVGGVRIEDIVVVTEDGYENLTSYPVELVV